MQAFEEFVTCANEQVSCLEGGHTYDRFFAVGEREAIDEVGEVATVVDVKVATASLRVGS